MYGFLMRLATSDVKKARGHRDTFVQLFNDRDTARSVASPGSFVAPALAAVCAELMRPDSAQFGTMHFRACSDGTLRAAGAVSFAGRDDQRSQSFYLIEIDESDRLRLLEITDNNPILNDVLPQDPQWSGGLVAYASTKTPQIRRDWFWPIFWIVSILVLLLVAVLKSFLQ